MIIITDLLKDEILALKRNSSKTSREIRKFWLKIDKVVAFRQKGEADDVRQKVCNDKTNDGDNNS